MTDKPYDSTQDTLDHIHAVRSFLATVVNQLEVRKLAHDLSKLEIPEKEMFDEFTPRLRSLNYGSDEYKQTLAAMGPALEHHYENNSHHPEHYINGVNGMSLLDVIEMLADWKAAGMRHTDGKMSESLRVNRDRFQIGDQLFEIIENTVRELGW